MLLDTVVARLNRADSRDPLNVSGQRHEDVDQALWQQRERLLAAVNKQSAVVAHQLQALADQRVVILDPLQCVANAERLSLPPATPPPPPPLPSTLGMSARNQYNAEAIRAEIARCGKLREEVARVVSSTGQGAGIGARGITEMPVSSDDPGPLRALLSEEQKLSDLVFYLNYMEIPYEDCVTDQRKNSNKLGVGQSATVYRGIWNGMYWLCSSLIGFANSFILQDGVKWP
jgi:hypothetical protein